MVGYWCEGEGTIVGCKYEPPPAYVVSTEIENQFENGYIHLSSWLKPQKIVPCGFQVCFYKEGSCITCFIIPLQLVYSLSYVNFSGVHMGGR